MYKHKHKKKRKIRAGFLLLAVLIGIWIISRITPKEELTRGDTPPHRSVSIIDSSLYQLEKIDSVLNELQIKIASKNSRR
jgi:hypothetical protein